MNYVKPSESNLENKDHDNEVENRKGVDPKLCPTNFMNDTNLVKDSSPALRRVSFPKNDRELITGYMEPTIPWISGVVNITELLDKYKLSCEKHKVKPLPTVLDHLHSLNLLNSSRSSSLKLKGNELTPEDCEALEEIFKKVQYQLVDISNCDLNDVAASALFDMFEFYETANEIDISGNPDITARGWQSCISMIKRSRALQMINASGVPISEIMAGSMGKSLNTSYLSVLKLEHCGLTGRPIISLCNAIKRNVILKELWLANNDFSSEDAAKIGELLRVNMFIQFLDISNNTIQDLGIKSIVEALIQQSTNCTCCAHTLKKDETNHELVSKSEANTSQVLNTFDMSDAVKIPKNKNILAGRSKLDALLCLNNEKASQSTPETNNDKSEHLEAGISNESVFKDPVNRQKSCFIQPDEAKDLGKQENTFLSPNNNFGGLERSAKNSMLENEKAVFDDNKNENDKYHKTSIYIQAYDQYVLPEKPLKTPSAMSFIENNKTKTNLMLKQQLSNRNNIENSDDHYYEKDNYNVYGLPHGNGLQGIVVWNNNITRLSGKYISALLSTTKSLEFLNIGKNILSNEFIFNIQAALKNNKTLLNLGLQSAHLTGDGIKMLSNTLQFGGNSTLQRIDIRDNNVQVNGLVGLADALKSNKSITRIDIDEDPKRLNEDEGETQFSYARALQTVQTFITRNVLQTESVSNTKANVYHPSRKISLTCQSLGTSLLESKKSLKPETNVYDLKRKPSSRLRSPLPSPPIISPSSSPVPSPSRSRFQVFRVIENTRSNENDRKPRDCQKSGFDIKSSELGNIRIETVVNVTAPPLISKPDNLCGPLNNTHPKVVEDTNKITTENNPCEVDRETKECSSDFNTDIVNVHYGENIKLEKPLSKNEERNQHDNDSEPHCIAINEANLNKNSSCTDATDNDNKRRDMRNYDVMIDENYKSLADIGFSHNVCHIQAKCTETSDQLFNIPHVSVPVSEKIQFEENFEKGPYDIDDLTTETVAHRHKKPEFPTKACVDTNSTSSSNITVKPLQTTKDSKHFENFERLESSTMNIPITLSPGALNEALCNSSSMFLVSDKCVNSSMQDYRSEQMNMNNDELKVSTQTTYQNDTLIGNQLIFHSDDVRHNSCETKSTKSMEKPEATTHKDLFVLNYKSEDDNTQTGPTFQNTNSSNS